MVPEARVEAVNTNGPEPNSVFIKTGGGDWPNVRDLETAMCRKLWWTTSSGDLENPAINNTANHGPFHVLFYAPDDDF